MSDPDRHVELILTALQLADRACISDIESEAVLDHVQQPGNIRWLDTRPMLDPREMPDDFIEMNRQALGYAEARGLIARFDAEHPYVVRITRQAGVAA
jgi:hypothetical protein